MRKYCISYDATDSKKYQQDPTFYRKIVVEALAEIGCTDFHMPVATTILFHYEDNNIITLNNQIKGKLEKLIFYYLCLVAQNSESKKTFDVGNPDNDLGESFDDFVETL
jgi:hypothetical protein